MTIVTEFCVKCGASFLPREGEGTCKDWKKCEEDQINPVHPDTCRCEECRFWGA